MNAPHSQTPEPIMEREQMRKDFERAASAPPFERDISRWDKSPERAWPGQYRDVQVEFAWEMYQAALSSIPAVVEILPDLTGTTQEQRDKRMAAMEQAYPKLSAFFSKHACGSLLCPSCLKCGQQTQPEDRGIQHMELPDIFLCKACLSAPHSATSPAPPEAGGGYVLNWQPIATAPKDGHTLLGKRDSPAVRAPSQGAVAQEPVLWVSPQIIKALQEQHVPGQAGPVWPYPTENATIPLYTEPPAQGEGWQPIKTAPKTKKDEAAKLVIMGYAPDEEGFSPSSREGFWNPDKNQWFAYGDPGWAGVPQPTHWQPLPAPPVDERG